MCSYRKRNEVELELLDFEALLAASENVAEQLRMADYVQLGDTVLELCRRLRAAKAVFATISETDKYIVDKIGVSEEDWGKIVLGDFGV